MLFFTFNFFNDTVTVIVLLSDFQALFDKVSKDPKGLEGRHLRLERVPVCSCIHVKGLKKGTSNDTIELYFENNRKSGGSCVNRVERIEKDEVLVYFKDSSSKFKFFSFTLFKFTII